MYGKLLGKLEIAAYELDRLLKLDRVPPKVGGANVFVR